MLRKVIVLLSFVCVSLQAYKIETVDGRERSIKSFYQLPCSASDEKIIATIITKMAENKKRKLLVESIKMHRLGNQIDHVHPLRFLGYIISDPQLKQHMDTILKDSWKWWSFLGSKSRKGFVKNMMYEMKRKNVYPHLYGFVKHIDADYDRVIEYIDHKDYEGMAKYLIRH